MSIKGADCQVFFAEKPLDLEDSLTMWLTCTLILADASADDMASSSSSAAASSSSLTAPPSPSHSAKTSTSQVPAAVRGRVLGDLPGGGRGRGGRGGRPVRVEELQMDLSDGRFGAGWGEGGGGGESWGGGKYENIRSTLTHTPTYMGAGKLEEIHTQHTLSCFHMDVCVSVLCIFSRALYIWMFE
jgi:hypothetical protein